ncbi:MAG: SDR family oxidoreductase [Sphingomonadales bacterium]|nr:SDR family oxidoreductase [Sphingomonadales bacterium]
MARPAVLITGGARRIGAAIARGFGAAGWHVVLHYGRSRAAAETLARELPSAECVACDLADSDAALVMVRALAARLPDWRMLVNSAAVFRLDTVAALDPAVFAETMAVDALAPARMAQAFLAAPEDGGARAAGGRCVLHLLDMKIANPNPDFFSYTMAKHALAATVRMLAMGAQARGRARDRVYGLAPGAMLPSHDQADDEHERSGRMNLLQRLTDPGELATAALFLAGGHLASGETIFVDSGQHLLAQPRDVLYLARA